MKILERIKAAFTTDKPSRYEAASSATLIGRDYVPPPFNYHQAVIECRSWVYAAARLNAVAVASAPLRLYVKNRSAGTKLWNTRRTGRRTKAYLSGDLAQLPSRYAMQKAAEYGDDYEIVTDAHPLLTLLAKVNPYQNGFDAAVLRVLYTELTGNAYLHPVIDPALGVPVELWTMPPQWMKIVPGNPQRGEPWITGYEYGRNDAQRQDFTPDEVIHFKNPNPRDLYYGLGKVESAWGAVTSNQALHEMDYHFFANKSRPDYLLVTQGNASDEELERFTAQVETKLRGTNKTGRFLAITGQVDLKPLQFPPKDLQGREEIVEEIAAVFGVPVSMLRANDPNLASATVGFATWKETTILPMLRMDEEVLNQNLLPLFGIEEDAFLAYDNPVRADESLESTKRLSYVAGGILTINEARMQEGLDPLPAPLADRPLIGGQPLGGAMPFGGIGQPAPRPAAEEQAPVAPQATAAPQEAIADTALNGAQVTSLVDLATAVGTGALPKETAIAIAAAAFPAIAPNQIRAMFDPIERVASPDQLSGPLDAPADEAEEIASKSVETKDALGDCVSAKIPTLLAEGYPQDQAVAIAYSMCAEGKTLEQVLADRPAEKACGCYAGGEKSCGCGCAKQKRVKQSDFVGKHSDGLASWLRIKNAEGEAEEISKSEDKAARAVSAVFDEQVKALLEELAKAETPSSTLIARAETILRSRNYQRALVDALAPYLREALSVGVNIGIDTVSEVATNVDFELEREDLTRYAQTESVRLARQAAEGVTTQTSVRVGEVLGDGLAQGETVDQLATRVQDWADKQKDEDGSWSRARMIARTESQRAARVAEVEAWKSTGLVRGKTWLLAPDPCEFCEAVAKRYGEKSIGLGEAFYQKGDLLFGVPDAQGNTREMLLDYEDIQGPPLHPNCRCSMQPLLSEEAEARIQEIEDTGAVERERQRILAEEGNR